MNGRRVLVVDDEEVICEILKEDLTQAGFEVLTANDGLAALEIVRNQQVDAVVSDIRMPGVGGFELIETINDEIKPRPMMLIVTAFADVSMEKAHQMGVEAIFPKPLDSKLIIVSLDQSLSAQAAANQSGRVDSRVPSLSKVGVKVELESKPITCEISNVGKGGMFLEMKGPMPEIGVEINFRWGFECEGQLLLIHGTAEIRWRREFGAEGMPRGVGCRFQRLEGDSRENIFQYINLVRTLGSD